MTSINVTYSEFRDDNGPIQICQHGYSQVSSFFQKEFKAICYRSIRAESLVDYGATHYKLVYFLVTLRGLEHGSVKECQSTPPPDIKLD